MSAEKRVTLHRGKEKFVLHNRHPWIFSGAIESFSKNLSPGECAHVYSHDGIFLAVAYFHMGHSLAGRILSFEKKPIIDILKEKLCLALSFRKQLFHLENTNAFRWINAEEDGLPGLIVDVYHDVGVIQISTLGMETLKSALIPLLLQSFPFRALYEKSTSSSRAQEGLPPVEAMIYGEPVEEVEVKENNLRWIVSIQQGQKTGFFLDQREMRKKIQEISFGKTVLNCFSYSGGFSLFALRGGASHVTSVDICTKATDLAKRNTLLNGFSLDMHRIVQKDVFSFLQQDDLTQYDIIIMDPPAFAKKRQDTESALRGYKDLNYQVVSRCKPNTFFLTCSCSYFVEESSFKHMLFQVAASCQKEVKIIHSHIRAMDHFVSVYHPEGDYIKSFLLWIA